MLLLFGLIGLVTNEDNWTVRTEILSVSGLFILIGIFQFLIRD